LPDVPWLSEAPVSGTLTAPGTQVVYVTFDASVPAVTQPGSYYATLQVQTSDPVNGNLPVPVTMTVGSPATWGKLNGTVTGLAQCDAPGAPLNKAKVFIQSSTGMTSTLETNASGYYQLWLDQSNSPLSLTVSYAGYLTQTITGVTVIGQQTTTQNVNLRLLAPCASVTPGELSSSQRSNEQMTRTLTINNAGAASLNWNIQEAAAMSKVAQPTGSTERLRVSEPRLTNRSGRLDSSAPLANVVQDGGFEAGTPNPYWQEYSLVFGTPLCDVASCGTGGGTAGPHMGNWWTWFGGSSTGDIGWVTQTVVITTGSSASLSFWLWVGAAASGPNDYMRVYLDSTPLYTANVAVATAAYELVTVTVPATFADGQPHVLRFASETSGPGNIHVDDVMLDVTGGAPSACQPNSIPWVTSVPTNGVTAGDSTSPVVVTFDSTGYASGVYTGSLCVNTSDPAKPTIMVPLTMTVQNPPTCSFTSSSPDDLGETTVFTNTTTGDAPLTYRWNLGDGSPVSAATHPTHTYAHVGLYTVILTAANNLGEDVCSNPVSIEGIEASFTSNSPVVQGTPVVFTNTTQANPSVLNWLWSFGDSTFDTSQTPPPHIYPGVGVYTVTLTAISTKGSDTYTDTVTVMSACEPVTSADFIFTPAAPRVGETVTFTGTSTGGTSPITYTWTFGDGGVGSGAVVTHLFPLTATVKTYTVTLSAANACTSPAITMSKGVTVHPRYVYLPITLK